MRTPGVILSVICTVAAAVLAVCVIIEHQAQSALAQQNQALREQLSPIDAIIAENQRLSNLAAQATSPAPLPSDRREADAPTGGAAAPRPALLPDDRKEADTAAGGAPVPRPAPLPSDRTEAAALKEGRAKELVRLRSEVEVLRRQNKELEAVHEEARLASAVPGAVGTAPSSAGPAATAGTSGAPPPNEPQFEILQADYGTEKTKMDVTRELINKYSVEPLKATANNDLKGDPDFGQPKRLTVVYRVGGITRTNEYREGEPVVFPSE
jgi:hypothetical protein